MWQDVGKLPTAPEGSLRFGAGHLHRAQPFIIRVGEGSDLSPRSRLCLPKLSTLSERMIVQCIDGRYIKVRVLEKFLEQLFSEEIDQLKISVSTQPLLVQRMMRC